MDYALPSTVPRLFILDLRTGAVAAYLTAHGKGSDADHDGLAERFADEPGSNASSLGAFVTLQRYHGAHGLSLRLRGLDPSNANAEARAVVLHSAPYMDAPFRGRHGRPGRSFGCLVVETAHVADVVARLEDGVLIYVGR